MNNPQPLGTFQAVLLDMDGTLVDSDAVVNRVWRRWAERHRLDGDAVLRVVHGRQGQATMAALLPDRPMAENIAENTLLLAEETADLDGVVPVTGAAGFTASLTGRPHALVTSANRGLATARMGAAGLGMPPVIVTAEDVSASKPDPEGFLKAAAELGFAARDCVVFEDSEAGVSAGLAAGMRVVGVGPRAAAFRPTIHVGTLHGLRVEPTGGTGLTLRFGG